MKSKTNHQKPLRCLGIATLGALLGLSSSLSAATIDSAGIEVEIRTPKAPATPRINGPGIFGVRPGHPFFYHIPVTGDRPMEYSVSGLPAGLKLDAKTGLIVIENYPTGLHVRFDAQALAGRYNVGCFFDSIHFRILLIEF